MIIDEKPEYHLSTGNNHLDANDQLGVKPRKSKKIESGESVESKSMIISQNNMHASMNTRDSSKGIFRTSKSVLYDQSSENHVGADLITREDGYNLGMGRSSRPLSGDLPPEI
jgi:hypothetical protein